LAPESAVLKLSGKDIAGAFRGPAVVFDGEEQAFRSVMNGQASFTLCYDTHTLKNL